MCHRPGGDLGSRGIVQLGEDIGDMMLGGTFTDHQRLRDRPIGESLGDQYGNLTLALGKSAQYHVRRTGSLAGFELRCLGDGLFQCERVAGASVVIEGCGDHMRACGGLPASDLDLFRRPDRGGMIRAKGLGRTEQPCRLFQRSLTGGDRRESGDSLGNPGHILERLMPAQAFTEQVPR